MEGKKGISGPCVACDNIVSFEASTCPKCGQPNAGEKAKATAEAVAKLTKADYEKVTRLEFTYNQLTELPKGLENLTQLEVLWLGFNKLTDVRGLEKLTQLKELSLLNNPNLTKAQIAELQKALPECLIYSDFD